MENWNKLENENGFVFYVNYSYDKNLQQWDHPKFVTIKQAIDECNYIVYPLYRLASKFRVLQRCFFMEEIPLKSINSTFEKHKLGNTENSLYLESCELEAVLFDMFFNTKKYSNSHDIDFACDLVLNFVYNVFDSFRETKVQVFPLKILLAILSNSCTTDLYKYLFFISADHNNCITRLRLKNLLLKIYEIIKYLHEDVCFDDQALEVAIEDCFEKSPGLVGVTENNFIVWLQSEPTCLAWIAVISRLKATETIMYSIKCKTCNIKPLMGLKYTCIKCSNYVQCQRCFFTSRISHSHKLTHSVKEYCGNSTGDKNKCNSLFSNLINFFNRKHSIGSFSIICPSNFLKHKRKDIKPLHDIVEPLSSPQNQLQSIIKQLEAQNKDLQQMLIFGKYTDKTMTKYLEEYRIFMADNIKKLKNLKNQINIATNVTETNINSKLVTNPESTPKIHSDFNNQKNIYLEQFSPITPVTTITNIEDNIKPRKIATNQAQVPYNYPIKQPIKIVHNDLDKAIEQLQHILANVYLDDSLNSLDNTNLKYAVTEVEGMLTSIIDNVETSRSNSALHDEIRNE